MELHETVTVTVHASGTVRVYGDGGLVYEGQGKYVKTECCTDPRLPPLSGTATKAKQG